MDAAPDGSLRRARFLSGIRARLLLWFVLLLAVASAASVLVARQVLLHRLDERIDGDLVQETRELRALAAGNDPETGQPFGDRVDKIFEVFLRRNIPSRNEQLLTFVDGELFLRSERPTPYRLDQNVRLARRLATLRRPERGAVASPVGTVEYLAVPVLTGGPVDGVFVVAILRDLERRETDEAIAGVVVTGGIVLLVGSLLAWVLAERILRPVRVLSSTARSISSTDLKQRIDVDGHDEIADLARTFNEMLGRLEEAFSAQKQFLDDVGHELRTPITIIRGQLETMEAFPEERPKVIALVLDELERMSRLVEDLMLLARSERPDFLDLDLVDVEALTREVFAKAEAIAPRQWVLETAGRGRIVADRQRVTQALLQLAQNATQHTDPGALVAMGSQIHDGEVSFWVRDTGPGITPEDRQRIFARFERAGSRRSEGAGLGLAIVSAIARAHHGDITVDSTPGQGATFRLVIPVDQPVSEEGPG